MDEAHERSHVLDLVGLHMPGKVPCYIFGQYGCFGRHLLDVVLAKHTLPGIVGLLQCLDGLKLGYSKQAHSLGERAAQLLYFVGDGHGFLNVCLIRIYIHDRCLGNSGNLVIANGALHLLVEVLDSLAKVGSLYESV